MRKEFGKIILSILITMSLTIIIKLINLTTFTKAYDEDSKMRLSKDIIYDGNRFTDQKMIPRLIAAFLMFILGMFIWLYSIGFCYIYYHTQKSWIYSGIWSLFWVWIIFAPLFLFLISLYESITGNEGYSYYMKSLFCF